MIGASHEHPINDGDIQLFLAEMIVLPIQYGMRRLTCQHLTAGTNDKYETRIASLMQFSEVKWSDYDRFLLAKKDTKNEMRQWTYQYCTEFGWFQTPSKVDKSHQMRSSDLNEAWWYNLCTALYGDEVHSIRAQNVKTIG